MESQPHNVYHNESVLHTNVPPLYTLCILVQSMNVIHIVQIAQTILADIYPDASEKIKEPPPFGHTMISEVKCTGSQ